MSERSTMRLVVFGVLVVSLLVTLVGRMFYMQVVTTDVYRQASAKNNVKEVVTPAARGLILDQAGRPLVSNRVSLVVSVDRTQLQALDDKGVSLLRRLAKALGTTYADIEARMTPCGTRTPSGFKPKPPICWNGTPFQPVPVAKDVPTDVALKIMERRQEFPGVRAELDSIRRYPGVYGVNAAHLLGYLGPVSQDELDAQPEDTSAAVALRRNDLVGRAGLESEYDAYLRGRPGITRLAVDNAGRVTGRIGATASRPGAYLVTSIDARLQKVVEQQLAEAVKRARTSADTAGYPDRGDSGAAVVIDTTDGRVLAMASYPSYDPDVWVGGISSADYARLVGDDSGEPLTSRATQGLFAPGSTFKVVTTSAAASAGSPLGGTYPCPNVYRAGNRTFANHESHGYGTISLARALEVSCNTVFYGIADRMWKAAGGLAASATAADPVSATAKAYGLGSRTGIDLPAESRGQVGSRAYKQALWDSRHDAWCASAKAGYPELRRTNPSLADEYTALDRENCVDGFRYREGDALNTAIGQGDTAITPLQLAVVYAAIANGGTLWRPQVGKALVGSDGTVVKQIAPVSNGRAPATPATLAWLRAALRGVTENGTGKAPFKDFPLDKIPVASKTGSAQVAGKASTSWFASFAPATKPRYAVVMMVTQGGTGSGTSGPSVRKIYEAIFGVDGTTVDPSKSVLVGGAPQSKLPTIRKDGTPVSPESRTGTTPSATATATAAATPAAGAAPSASEPGRASPGGSPAGALALPALFGAGLAAPRGWRRRRRARRRGTAGP